MAGPVSPSCFNSLPDYERTVVQTATSGQEFEVVTIPLVHTPTSKLHVRRVGARDPVVVRLASSTASRGKVVHTTATSASLTTTGVSQRLRPVVAHEDTLMISVPVYPEQRQPLGSLFDSLRKFVEQEKQQMIAQPVGQELRLPPPKQHQPRKSQQPQQQYYPQQQHQYPSASYSSHARPAYSRSSPQARADFWQRVNRPFPFKREAIPKIFKNLLKRSDFQLPELTKPDKISKTSDPRYCRYHRIRGHVLEDCLDFKEWLERGLKEGSVVIPDEYLMDPPSGSTKVIFDLMDDLSDPTDD